MAEKALVHRMEQAALTTKIRLLDLAHQTLIHICTKVFLTSKTTK